MVCLIGFVKLQHIPGNLEGQIYLYNCVHVEGRPYKAMAPHCWLNIMPYTMKTSGGVVTSLTRFEGMQHAHRATQQRMREFWVTII